MSENYQVLARKYRPQTFADLLGQDVLVETLKNAIEHHRIPHAILLTGVRGIGKTTTARIIARALNCKGKDGKGAETISPCGQCQPCVDILDERHLDVIEMDAASRTSVDDIRQVIEAAYYKPSSARYKIQIIDEVHMLTKQAFNALLKTLEEPPEYTKFIFATTELNRIPDTIISRCVRFDLKRFDRLTLKELLQRTCQQESIAIQEEAISLLAQAANGSARDAQSLLERAISLSPGTITDEAVRSMLGLSGQGDVLALLNHIFQGETANALTFFDNLYQNGADPDQLLRAVLDLIHELSCLKVSSKFSERSLLAKEQLDQLQELAGRLSVPVLSRLWQVLTKGREELKSAPSSAQAAEMILIRACHLSALPTSQAVIAELAKQHGAGAQVPSSHGQTGSVDGAQVVTQEVTQTAQKKTSELETPQEHSAPLETDTQGVQDFQELVELFDTHKEPLLKYEFENHVRLIDFDPKKSILEIALTADITPGFTKRSRELLENWTSKKWIINECVEPEGIGKAPQQTLRVQRQKAQDTLLQDVRKTELVKTALDMFPGAEIKNVKQLKGKDG